MYKIYLRLIKKAIILFIITFLPLGTYLYLNEEVQTTFISNIDNNQCKYILDAEFNPTKNKIYIFEKVIFINKTNKKMDRIYFYLGNNKIGIKDVRINNKQVGYKIIGNDNILMVISNIKIGSGDTSKIDVDYEIDIENNKKLGKKGNSINYNFDIWYPVILYHDNNEWDLKSVLRNTPKILEGDHHVKIFIPLDYALDITNRKNNSGFYQLKEINNSHVPIIIRNTYEEN